jgi:hypothetical protein
MILIIHKGGYSNYLLRIIYDEDQNYFVYISYIELSAN